MIYLSRHQIVKVLKILYLCGYGKTGYSHTLAMGV